MGALVVGSLLGFLSIGLHLPNQLLKPGGLLRQLSDGVGGPGHDSGRFPGHPVDSIHGTVDRVAGRGLLFRRQRDGLDLLRRLPGELHDLFEFSPGPARQLRRRLHRHDGGLHAHGVALHLGLNHLHRLSHLLGGPHGTLGQAPHLIGHNGEAAPGFSGAGRFDTGVQRQQIGLVGDPFDDRDDAADPLGACSQIGHLLPEFLRGGLHLTDGAHASWTE